MKESVTVGEWADALRSGDYEQGQGALRSRDDKYCCLGVLCDLVGVTWTAGQSVYRASVPDAVGYTGSGLPPSAIHLPTKVDKYTLVDLNDKRRTDFNTIADYLERNVGRDEVVTVG